MYSKEEKKKLIITFWKQFDLFCNQFPELKGKPKKWILHNTKIKGITLKFEIGRSQTRVVMEIAHRNPFKREMIFELLEKYKILLEEGFSVSPCWSKKYTKENEQEVSEISFTSDSQDFHKQEQWNEIFEFMSYHMRILQTNFLEIRDLIKEEVNTINHL